MRKTNEIWLAAYADMRPQKRKSTAPNQNNSDLVCLPEADDIFASISVDPNTTVNQLNAIGGVFARYLNEVQMHGTNPDVAIYKLIRENQVLLFCQSNAIVNSFREFGARLMPGLARRGATHLVIERPEIFSEDFSRLVLEAKNAGLKVEEISPQDTNPSKNAITALAAISKALWEPTARVIFWGGNSFLEKRVEEKGLGDYLRDNNIKAASINGVSVAAEHGSHRYPMTELIPLLADARIVETKKTPDIARCVYNTSSSNKGTTCGDFDYFYIAGKNDLVCKGNKKLPA